MQTKISVVIPTYMRSKLLTRCLSALSGQSLEKHRFEVLVVSDGPDPETETAIEPWLKKRKLNLSYLNTTEKKGPAAARNMGWLSARSPLIAFTDDDCIPDRRWLQSMLNCYKGQDLLAFSGNTRVPLPEDPTDFALNTAQLQKAEFITANCACTKAALLKTGGFDERFKLAWREDSDLHFKLLELQIPIVKATNAIVVHPVRSAQWGVSIKEQKKSAYDALLFKKYPNMYRNKINQKPLWNYYLINLLWIALIVSMATGYGAVTRLSVAGLAMLLITFTLKRLRNSSRSVNHILEMLSTSAVIPTLSIYWRIYGAVKYKVLFI
jgi:glycosyltransferase involved in cell wall biosynthesis